jgi:hypothetical protein
MPNFFLGFYFVDKKLYDVPCTILSYTLETIFKIIISPQLWRQLQKSKDPALVDEMVA